MRILIVLMAFMLSSGIFAGTLGTPPVQTVCSSGCDFTTINTAYSSSPEGTVIELQGNIADENQSLTKNIDFRSSGSNKFTWNGNGSGGSNTVTIGAGIAEHITFTSLVIAHDTGGAENFKATAWTSGQIVEFTNVTFQRGGAAGPFVQTTSDWAATDALVFRRCTFNGGSAANEVLMQGATTANSRLFENCIFRDFTNGALHFQTNSANSTGKVFNCVFDNSTVGLVTNARGDYKNNIFTNNTTDISFVGSSNTDDLVTNAFEQEAGPLGTGNIFGITSTDEYVDESIDDFHLKAGAQSIGAGTDLSGSFTNDFDDVTRTVPWDIGAFKFISTGAAIPFQIIILD